MIISQIFPLHHVPLRHTKNRDGVEVCGSYSQLSMSWKPMSITYTISIWYSIHSAEIVDDGDIWAYSYCHAGVVGMDIGSQDIDDYENFHSVTILSVTEWSVISLIIIQEAENVNIMLVILHTMLRRYHMLRSHSIIIISFRILLW